MRGDQQNIPSTPADSVIGNYLQLELKLGVVPGRVAVDRDLSAELHGQGSHEDALAVGVRHRDHVLLAPRQQRQPGATLQHGARRIT